MWGIGGDEEKKKGLKCNIPQSKGGVKVEGNNARAVVYMWEK